MICKAPPSFEQHGLSSHRSHLSTFTLDGATGYTGQGTMSSARPLSLSLLMRGSLSIPYLPSSFSLL